VLDPGKFTVSGSGGSSSGTFYSQSAGNEDQINSEIGSGSHPLKPTQTVDKSKPLIEADVKVKKVDRSPFLSEVAGEHDLSHVAERNDRSDPHIDPDTHVKKADRSFLQDIAKNQED